MSAAGTWRSQCESCSFSGHGHGADGLASLAEWAGDHEARTGHRVRIERTTRPGRPRRSRTPQDSLAAMFDLRKGA